MPSSRSDVAVVPEFLDDGCGIHYLASLFLPHLADCAHAADQFRQTRLAGSITGKMPG